MDIPKHNPHEFISQNEAAEQNEHRAESQIALEARQEALDYLNHPKIDQLARQVYGENLISLVELQDLLGSKGVQKAEKVAKLFKGINPRNTGGNAFMERADLMDVKAPLPVQFGQAVREVSKAEGLREPLPLPENFDYSQKYDALVHGGVGATPRTRLAEIRKRLEDEEKPLKLDTIAIAGSDRPVDLGKANELDKIRAYAKAGQEAGRNIADIKIQEKPGMLEFDIALDAALAWIDEAGLNPEDYDVVHREGKSTQGYAEGSYFKVVEFDLSKAIAGGKGGNLPNRILVTFPPNDTQRLIREGRDTKVKTRGDTEDAVVFFSELVADSKNNVIAVSHQPVATGQHLTTRAYVPFDKEVTTMGHYSSVLGGNDRLLLSEVCKVAENAMRIVEQTENYAPNKKRWQKLVDLIKKQF